MSFVPKPLLSKWWMFGKRKLGTELFLKTLSLIQSTSVNSRHQLIQFEVGLGLHYCKWYLHKIHSSVSPLYDWCKMTVNVPNFLVLLFTHWILPPKYSTGSGRPIIELSSWKLDLPSSAALSPLCLLPQLCKLLTLGIIIVKRCILREITLAELIFLPVM